MGNAPARCSLGIQKITKVSHRLFTLFLNVVARRNATTYRGIKQVRLCLARVGVAQCGRQVHLDQTKVVKGQDRKTLATAGTIKRPLPCPVKKGDKKTEYILQSEKKKQSKKKRKKIRKKTEKKRKETKKKRELVQWVCTNRSVSLSPPSNLTFFQNANKDSFFWGNNHSGPTPSKSLIPTAGFFSWGIICIEKRRSLLFGFAAAD